MQIKGSIAIDSKTKRLVKKILPNQIAIISHEDIDEIAAESLVTSKVKAVINTKDSLTGKYPNGGPRVLLDNKIPLIDCVGEKILDNLVDGDEIVLDNEEIWLKNRLLASGREFNKQNYNKCMQIARKNMNKQLSIFTNNTLHYAQKEKDLFLNNITYPHLKTNIKGKEVVIVIRGQDYKKDLFLIKKYIKKVDPILIGVDGGADAILEIGLKPDLIIGDMDSVSDKTLKVKCERIVHAYTNGKAPGIERLKNLGLDYTTFASPGTSEDIAMLLAYEKGSETIVAVGTHTNMIDFLEKGRKGMASTILVRMKIGNKLIDAKGINHLYTRQYRPKKINKILVPLSLFTPLPALFRYFYNLVIKFYLLFNF